MSGETGAPARTPPGEAIGARHPVPWVELGVLALALLVLAAGLVFPDLMGGDAAQDAVMAMRMHDEGDWVNLVKNGQDYLDKPHLLFWSAMLGYRAFGVHDWSYRLPSVLVTLVGALATWRLGRRLYGEPVGRIAALFFLTAYATLLGNHDVRMDALLTGFTALALWQLVRWLETGSRASAVLGGVALGLAFSAKGLVALAVAGPCLLFFVWSRGLWRRLLGAGTVLAAAAFLAAIAPVVAAYYVQFDLHPEKVVQGRTGVSGVRFVLLGQSVERFGGGKGLGRADDPLFFFHSLLWAFLPWSLLLYGAWLHRLGDLVRRRGVAFREREGLTLLGPLFVLVVLGFSRFKLPHYLNVLFPVLAVLAAAFTVEVARAGGRRLALFRALQLAVVCGLAAVAVLLGGWAYPVRSGWVIAGALVLAALTVLSFRLEDPLQRLWVPSAVAILAGGFVLATHLYPELGRYQPGRHLAAELRRRGIDGARLAFVDKIYQPLQFYERRLLPVLDEAAVRRERAAGKELVLVVGDDGLRRVRQAGIPHDVVLETPDCPVLKLRWPVLDPRTRARACPTAHVLAIPSEGSGAAPAAGRTPGGDGSPAASAM